MKTNWQKVLNDLDREEKNADRRFDERHVLVADIEDMQSVVIKRETGKVDTKNYK